MLGKLSEACSLVLKELCTRALRQHRMTSSFDRLPWSCLVHVLGFARLDHTDVLKCISTVWLKVVRSWGLRRRISLRVLPLDTKMSMTKFIALLEGSGCQHFRGLDSLRLPPGCSLGKLGCTALAKTCPHLRELNLGYMYSGVSPKPVELLAAAGAFPMLSSMRLSLRGAKGSDVAAVARHLGPRLCDLRVEGAWTPEAYLSDACLQTIARSCPSLESFAIHYDGFSYDEESDTLTDEGVGLSSPRSPRVGHDKRGRCRSIFYHC